MEAPNSRCASPPKQNMSTLSHHVAALSASSAVSDPPPPPSHSLSSVFERLKPHQRSHFSCLSTLNSTPSLVIFLTHLHSKYDGLRSAKFHQMSVGKSRPFRRTDMLRDSVKHRASNTLPLSLPPTH